MCTLVGETGTPWILGKGKGVFVNPERGIGTCEADLLRGPHCLAGEFKEQVGMRSGKGEMLKDPDWAQLRDCTPECFSALSALQPK